MVAEFNIEQRWPELFEPLTDEERSAVVNTLASVWHEGWEPNRDHVENLTRYASGAITREEYDRREDERSRQSRVENDLTMIEKSQQLAGHFPDAEALDRARRVLDGRTTPVEAYAELDAKYTDD